ncbi:hypothetical protein [Azospirillum griseum]|uniref:Uncharacterized protein n=1 Tax=Azospirillum griseum TaxID=2496639 RepID=A0A3S0I3N3_9PROT|nr:hypothetical protein [Azospirillum griseum]RTR23622.1 hypothetical protein EJ903_03575 [Azospirillum griseum]
MGSLLFDKVYGRLFGAFFFFIAAKFILDGVEFSEIWTPKSDKDFRLYHIIYFWAIMIGLSFDPPNGFAAGFGGLMAVLIVMIFTGMIESSLHYYYFGISIPEFRMTRLVCSASVPILIVASAFLFSNSSKNTNYSRIIVAISGFSVALSIAILTVNAIRLYNSMNGDGSFSFSVLITR